MNAKKTATSKRTHPPRAVQYMSTFTDDWTRLSHSGRYDMVRLKEVMLLLIANDAPLGSEWKDHPLRGEWADHRECHVGGDFLLIYKIHQIKKFDVIIFVRAGTHSDLFS